MSPMLRMLRLGTSQSGVCLSLDDSDWLAEMVSVERDVLSQIMLLIVVGCRGGIHGAGKHLSTCVFFN